MVAAATLMHKREQEEWVYIVEYDGIIVPCKGRYSSDYIWFWGLERWGKIWPKIEYRVSEMNRRKG